MQEQAALARGLDQDQFVDHKGVLRYAASARVVAVVLMQNRRRYDDLVCREYDRITSAKRAKLPRVKRMRKKNEAKNAKRRHRPGWGGRCERQALTTTGITVDQLKAIIPPDSKCPGCGEVMLVNSEDRLEDLYATLDRFIATSEYLIDLVHWLCSGCNLAKGGMPWSLFEAVCPVASDTHAQPWSTRFKRESNRTTGHVK